MTGEVREMTRETLLDDRISQGDDKGDTVR